MSAESLVVGLLNDHDPLLDEGLEAFGDVPADRPERFITVERTGGARGSVTDSPMFAVQVWAESRYEAVRLAELVADELRPALLPDPRIARVSVNSVYNFPDPAGAGSPRAQVVVEIVTTI